MLGTSANRSANPQIADSRFLVCGFANRFLTANICGKKIEIYRKSANQQHHWDRFCNLQKNRYLQFNVSTDMGGCISNVQHPLTKFFCCGTIISQRCCYSYSKTSWIKVKKLLTACFCEGKLARQL